MKKAISAFFLGMAPIFLIAWLYLIDHYAATRPRKPDTLTGHTQELNMHGKIVYLNDKEALLLHGSFVAGFVSCVAGGLLWKRT